jgi:RNA polymerase sigma-70 factor (ECF subfamily)
LSQVRASGVLVDVSDETPDRDLVDRLRRGDVTAFDRVYSTYHPRVFSFLLRLSGRRDTAEDLAQETWIKLAKAAPGLSEDTTLAPFLFTIARNAFMSHRRWAMLDLSRILTFGLEALSAPATDTTPEAHHERARAIALLETALQRLPLASREVLLLVGVEGMEQEEVAKVLGLSYDATRQRLSRARAQLADAMDTLEKKQNAIAAGRRTHAGKRGEST